MIPDEQLAAIESEAEKDRRLIQLAATTPKLEVTPRGMYERAGVVLRLVAAYRELKAENEQFRKAGEDQQVFLGVAKTLLTDADAERERLINLSVALESELAAKTSEQTYRYIGHGFAQDVTDEIETRINEASS